MVGTGRRRASRRVPAIALLATVLWSCDFSNRTGPAAGLTVTLSSSSVAIAQGGTGSVVLTLGRTNGFADPVHVLVEGLPPGVTAGAPSFAAGETTGTLTLTAAGTAAVGTSALTVHVHATGSTAAVATAALALVIQPGGPAFNLSFAPAIVGVPQGASRSIIVTVARSGGFIGAVDLSATALPAGITAFFNPATVFAPTSTLTLTASPTVAVGAATITVRGTGTGVSSQVGTITVNVTPAGGGPAGNVSISFCPTIGAPIWVAFQDGTDPWVLSTAVNGVYSGQVSSGRGGIAYVVPRQAGGFELHTRYGTTAELQAFGEVVCYGATGTGKTVNAVVVGAPATDIVLLALGTSVTTASFDDEPRFDNVPDGLLDLVGARGSPSGTGRAVDKLFIQRGITPVAGSTVTVDFNGPGAVDPVFGTVTLENVGADQAVVSSRYRTANRTVFPYGFDTPGTSTSRTFGGFPPFAGSFHLVEVTAAPSFRSPDRMRAAGRVHSAIGNRTLTLGSELGSIVVAQAGISPPLRMEALVPATAYTGSWSVTFSQGTGMHHRSAFIHTTAGYVGGSPATVRLVVPDLSTVAGFANSWGLAETPTVDWTAIAQTLTGFGPQGRWQDGATFVLAARSGTFSHHE